MAFNILITKKKKVDFEKLNQLCSKLDRKYISVFPTNDLNNIKKQGIGLSVLIKDSYGNFFESFEKVLIKLIEQKFEVVELYNGKIIETKEDVKEMIEMIK